MYVYTLLIYVCPVAFPYTIQISSSETLDKEVLKKFCPITNLPLLSNLIQKVIPERLVSHMQNNGTVEKFPSAYKANHSIETARLRVYNDMLISIDQDGGATLVLLDLSSAFDKLIMPCYLIFGKIPLEYHAQHYLY